MATITGLTADRMLAIEAASVVDGDVVGDNLILTTHGGTQINAGSVRGPAGPQGPIGSDLAVLTAKPVLEVGLSGQIRAGRQLTAEDFTNMGLSAPFGLWNLSDLTDSSGRGRALSNKGAVAFDKGINGQDATAAKFVGNSGQVLYIPDSGAAEPLRIKVGSWGCWFRTGKPGTNLELLGRMSNISTNGNFRMMVLSNTLTAGVAYTATGFSGSAASDREYVQSRGFVTDDRWHFGVATFDGASFSLYLDGVHETTIATVGGLMFSTGAIPFNIGGAAADAAIAAINPYNGRIDEVFVTGDILTEDQIRNLYCAKIPHTLGAVPGRANLRVRRRRRGVTLSPADFATPPLRLYNFSGGSLGDEGSNNAPLQANNAPSAVSGADGTLGNAYSFYAPGSQNLSATDTGLMTLANPRSYGGWFKTSAVSGYGVPCLVGWGNTAGNSSVFMYLNGGYVVAQSGTDLLSGPFVSDGLWHHIVVTEENAPADGIKRRMYVDGRLVAVSLNIGNIGLMGANGFRIGCRPDSVNFFHGQVDLVFVSGVILSADEIYALYAKGTQALAPSPKNVGDHVEAFTATDLLATFDGLETVHQVDLAVAA